ncbi:hypothetical protein [Streptomyces sp. NPDC003015]
MSSRPSAKVGAFTIDAGSTGTERGTCEVFVDTWNARMGDLYPLPVLSASTVDGFRGNADAVDRTLISPTTDPRINHQPSKGVSW